MSCLKGVQRLLYKLYNITHTKYCMACSIGYILYNLYHIINYMIKVVFYISAFIIVHFFGIEPSFEIFRIFKNIRQKEVQQGP